jgi:hypothetical protein
MRSGFVLFTTVAVMISVEAQPAPLAGVIEGFTFDVPTRSVRPVVGTLGSATLGQPVFGELTFGSVSPHQNFALIFRGEHCAVLSGLGSSQTTMTQITGVSTAPDGVAWSGDGSTAVLYSRTGNWIQIISGLPSSISAGTVLSVASLQGSLSAAAADLHGGRVAIAVTGTGAGVYQIANGSDFVPLLAAVKPTALAFSEDGTTLYALDSGVNQLLAQNTADSSFQSWPLTGFTNPVAIRPARDASNRALVYVAGHDDRLLAAYDSLTHQLVASAPLSFQPNVIEPLGIGSYLLESRVAADDILQAFRNTPQPLVYFVPAAPVRSEEHHRK